MSFELEVTVKISAALCQYARNTSEIDIDASRGISRSDMTGAPPDHVISNNGIVKDFVAKLRTLL